MTEKKTINILIGLRLFNKRGRLNSGSGMIVPGSHFWLHELDALSCALEADVAALENGDIRQAVVGIWLAGSVE